MVWWGRGRASGWGMQTNSWGVSPSKPLVEGARSLTYCMVLNPPLHSRSPWMTLHLVAFGLFTLSGFPRELGSPLEPSIWPHSELAPPTTVAGKGFKGFIFVALLLTKLCDHRQVTTLSLWAWVFSAVKQGNEWSCPGTVLVGIK